MKNVKKVFLNDQGKILVRDVDPPALEGKGAIIKTVCSFIGSGSEAGCIIAARNNPGNGTKQTPLSYQSAGRIVRKSPDLEGYTLGDFVACTGMGFAYHAEICYIPKNMMAKVPTGVTTEEAASSNSGLTAMHALRRCQIELGETVLVIGLGMIGQLIAQIARVMGARVIGVDPIQARRDKALSLGANMLLNPNKDDIVNAAFSYTKGVGVDAAIVCAKAPGSVEPMHQACRSVRQRGRVVIVGVVKREIPAEVKEIDILISRGRGPGHGDSVYEKEGTNYPLDYVRWTENRNLQEYLKMVAEKKVDIQSLISHRFHVSDAAKAYETIIHSPEKVLGVLLQYDKTRTEHLAKKGNTFAK